MSKKAIYISIAVIILIIIAISSYLIGIKIDAKFQENKLVNEYFQNQGEYKNLSVKNNSNKTNSMPSMAETNQLVGVLTIPSIGLEAPVIEGLTPDNLSHAVAHFSNSAIPGQPGNAAFAANDRFSLSIFKNLADIKMGSLIDLNYKGNTYQYKVSAKQSESDATSFLTAIKQTTKSTLTLVEYNDGSNQILQVQAVLV